MRLSSGDATTEPLPTRHPRGVRPGKPATTLLESGPAIVTAAQASESTSPATYRDGIVIKDGSNSYLAILAMNNQIYALSVAQFIGLSSGIHLLITGGVHGDEWEPMAACRRLIARFQRTPLRSGTLTIIPVVNEPAFRRASRTADDGLDLARTCPGRVEGSITERIAFAVSERIRQADRYIDLHTGGTACRITPLVGYMLHPDEAILAEQRHMAKAFALPIIWGTDSSLNGRTLSVARDAGVPAIYAEYHGGGTCDPAGIDAYEQGCLRVMAEYGMIDDAPKRPAITPLLVEDGRTNSGHLQRQHPAPSAGFFEPAVSLGQWVERGEYLGTVCDLLGNSRVSILAENAGIVLMLRTLARVEVGTALAAILSPD